MIKVNQNVQLQAIMFCCTRPNHQGQIITSFCQQQQCINNSTQLCCCQCIKQHHPSHSTVSMKNMMPELLKANYDRKQYLKLLEQLATFIEEQFNNDQYFKTIVGSNKLNAFNVVEATQLMLTNLKKKNKEENKKLRQIERTLQINSQANFNNAHLSPGKSKQQNYKSMLVRPNDQFNKMNRNYDSVPLSTSEIASIQSFSLSLKHPYITISPDMRSATKTSQAGGYKLAALSASAIPIDSQNIFFNLKIAKSSGNVLIGLGIAQIIKQKQYLNCYGAGQGAYLMGQNGNDPLTAILFHHSDNVFNRKQIVGWNFKEGQTIGVGIVKQGDIDFISFRKYHMNSNGNYDFKKTQKQFTMPLWPKGAHPQRLHVVVILQNVNDQVEFLPSQQ